MSSVIEHLLTVGATGMLADAVLELARDARRVTSIARTERSLARLDRMVREGSEGGDVDHTTIRIDYRNTDSLIAEIDRQITLTPIDRALVWMHGPTESNGVVDLARLLAQRAERDIDFVHVVGSAGKDLARLVDHARDLFAGIAGLRYCRIILGFVRTGDGRRWLTDEEISSGVVDAVRSGEGVWVVGEV